MFLHVPLTALPPELFDATEIALYIKPDWLCLPYLRLLPAIVPPTLVGEELLAYNAA
jgi:hypothetical protein